VEAARIMATVGTTGVDKAERDLSGFGKTVDRIGKGAGLALGGLVVAGAAAGAVAITALGVSTVGVAADFEKSLSSIEAVSGATTAEMEQISAAALQLGADTAFSAGEAAAGFEELIKGGLSIADAMAAAKPMLDLAAAGGIEVADAAEIAANAMGIFGLEGADMANVANQIAGAANASSLSVSDFQFAMAASGSVAAGVGQSFDDLATAIAVMGESGIKGSDAGTSLKTMLMNLQPSTAKQAALFDELGITTKGMNNEFINADGSFKSMAEIAEVLQTKTAHLTEAERALALETMFGSDAIRAANIFVREGAEGFDAMAESMGKVTAESVAATKLDNFSGAVDAMKGSMETLQIVIGTALLPVLTSLVRDHLTPVINSATAFATEFFNAGDKMGFLVTKINELIPGFETLVAWLQVNIPAAITALSTFWTTSLQPALVATSDILSITLIPALTTLGAFLLTNGPAAWAAFTASINTDVLPVLQTVADWFTVRSPAMIDQHTGDLTRGTTGWEDFQTKASARMTQFQADTEPLFTTIGQRLTDLQTALGLTGDTVGLETTDWSAAWSTAITEMTASSNEFEALMTANFVPAVQTAVEGLVTTGNEWEASWNSDIAMVREHWQSFLAKTTEVAVWVGIKIAEINGFMATLPETVGVKIGEAIAWFQGLPGRITSAVGDLSSLLVQAGKDVIQGMINGVESMIGSLQTAISGAARAALDAAKSALGIESPSKAMKDEVGVPMIDGVIEGMKDRQEKLNAMAKLVVVTALKEASDGTKQPAYTVGYEIGDQYVAGVDDSLKARLRRIKEEFRMLVALGGDYAKEPAYDIGYDVGERYVTGVTDSLKDRLRNIKEEFRMLVDLGGDFTKELLAPALKEQINMIKENLQELVDAGEVTREKVVSVMWAMTDQTGEAMRQLIAYLKEAAREAAGIYIKLPGVDLPPPAPPGPPPPNTPGGLEPKPGNQTASSTGATGPYVDKQLVLNVTTPMNVDAEFAGLQAWATAGAA
jgi:TP901 family phage tail tape measure protein